MRSGRAAVGRRVVWLVMAGVVLVAGGRREAYGDDSSGSDTTEPIVVELTLFSVRVVRIARPSGDSSKN